MCAYRTYQLAVLESIEHLEIAAALEAVEVRNMFPETIDTSECKKPLRVNLPCVPLEQNQKRKHVNHNSHNHTTKQRQRHLCNSNMVGLVIGACLLLFNTLETTLRDLVPVRWISLNFLKEFD